jgi:outer membrane murein-binding lipoprotein Lpp
MPFTVRDFQSLVRTLERHAEWKAELRRLLLTDELLALPQVVSALTPEVRELAAGQARLTEQVRELAAGQTRLTEQVRELAAGQTRLVDTQNQLTADVRALVAAVQSMADRLGELEGENLERRYRERAAGLFQQILARIRVLDHQELGLRLDDAVDAGTLTPEEKAEILRADVILRGRRDRRETYALAEVSAVIDAENVRRAAARAPLLQRVVGAPVLPVVAGRRLAEDAAQSAGELGVWRLLDGRADAPAEVGG